MYPTFIEFNSCHETPFFHGPRQLQPTGQGEWLDHSRRRFAAMVVAIEMGFTIKNGGFPMIFPLFYGMILAWNGCFSHCFMGCFSQSDQFFHQIWLQFNATKSDMSQVGGPGGDRDPPFLRPMGAPRIGLRILTWHWWKTWWIFGGIFGDIV